MKTISDKQLAANRANAQRSTGPRTAEGKARCAQNRTTHALTGAHAILPGEDPAAFERLKSALLDEYQPQTETEAHLVDEMAHNQWKLRRAEAMENRALARSCELDTGSGGNEPLFTDEVARLSRYLASIRRAWSNAHSRLRLVQNDRRRAEAEQLSLALDLAADEAAAAASSLDPEAPTADSDPFFPPSPESPILVAPSPEQADTGVLNQTAQPEPLTGTMEVQPNS